MHAFSLDRASGIPVKLQFMAQVRYQIAAGLLYPGDQLPPLRDLAAGLGINLNTIIRAVDELEAEGYLHSHQGKGVFVADEPPGQIPGAALRSLLAGVLGQGRDWSLTPEEAALALLAHGQLARHAPLRTERLLLVGSSRADLRRLQRELAAAIPGLTILPALPEEVSRTGAFKLVATTLFHSPPAQGGQVVLLAGAVERERFAQLRGMASGSRVAIAAGDWVQAARVRQSLEGAGLGHLQLQLAVSPADLEGAAFALATQSGRQMVMTARPDLPLLVEPLGIGPEALGAIRQGLGAPAPEQRVQIRSAWV